MNTPVRIAYGERYPDDSGWSRRIDFDFQTNYVTLDVNGSQCTISLEDWRWLTLIAIEMRFQPWFIEETPHE